jgi:hypothetical protein
MSSSPDVVSANRRAKRAVVRQEWSRAFGDDLYSDELFAKVDPVWSIKAWGLRSRRNRVNVVLRQLHPSSTEIFHGVPGQRLFHDVLEQLRSITTSIASIVIADLEEAHMLEVTTASREFDDGFLRDLAGILVEETTYAGRIVELDEDTAGVVLAKLGSYGARGDEFAARLPVARFGRRQRERLEVGGLFDWTFRDVVTPDGESTSKGRITLLDDELFTPEELDEVRHEAERLLPLMRDLVPDG